MKGTKKLKRILAVMTVAVTMTVMFSATAMAAPAEESSGASSEGLWGYPYEPGMSSEPSYPSQPDSYPESPSECRPNWWILDNGEFYPTECPEQPIHPSEESSHSSSVTYDPLVIIEEQTEHYYVKGSGVGVTITCNGEFSKFFSIFVDGVFLEKTNYTVGRGSTVLTIMPEYLDTLPVGAHTVTLNYTYGSVDSALNVAESNPNVENVSTDPQNTVSNQDSNNVSASNSNAASTGNTAAPKTGDTSAIRLWFMVVLASGCGCVVLMRRKRISSR